MFRRFILFIFFCLLFLSPASAQKIPVQTIKGIVLDHAINTPLEGATVVLQGTQAVSSITGKDGTFRLTHIPLGRQSIRVSFVGYNTITLSNLLLEAGKELVLVIEMEDQVAIGKEIILQSKTNKAMPLNEMAMVSSRMITVAETRRFAAGLNDPSRIATAFAGVNANGDGNALIIRGNAPNGLLWRMEGVNVPNPNHFSRVGTSGGGISIISAQLLGNSDFMISAFPAEYGNALSGVFDIKLRKGNKDEREHSFSISTVGIDASTEGYFKKGYAGSYLINYRYGFLTLLQKFGLNIGDAPTSFQDLSFNIHLPAKKIGNFSIFGFGGLSKQKTVAQNDSITWTLEPSKRSGWLDQSNTGSIGITHQITFSKKTMLRTIFSINAFNKREEDNRYGKINGPLIVNRKNRFLEKDAIVSTILTHKFNRHHLLKAGIYTTRKSFDLNQREAVNNVLKDKIKTEGHTRLTNAFIQWKCDPADKVSFQLGVQAQYFSLNKRSIVEPRMGIRFRIAKDQWLSVGAGLHSQVQPLGNYFVRIRSGNDTIQPNKGLGFSRSAQYVLGYAIQLSPNWNLKTELYYQWLYNIPVSAYKPTSYSILNQDDDYAIEALLNKGKGKNYGIELTLQRWWNERFYLLSTISLYQSTYLPSDDIWRSTRYNSNTGFTFLLGKEWNLKGKRSSTIAADVKLAYAGGQRVTPINLPQSILQRTTISDNSRIYGEKLADFFRMDLQAEWKIQYIHKTASLIAGVQNCTNRKNPVRQSYDPASRQIKYTYLLGIIPVFGIKVDL